MPSDKSQELRDLSYEDVQSELAETQLSYQKMRFDHALKGLEKPSELREVRRDIARLHTELRRRDLAEASPQVLKNRSKIRRRRRRKH